MKIFSREDLKNINGGGVLKVIEGLAWASAAGLISYSTYLSIKYKKKYYR